MCYKVCLVEQSNFILPVFLMGSRERGRGDKMTDRDKETSTGIMSIVNRYRKILYFKKTRIQFIAQHAQSSPLCVFCIYALVFGTTESTHSFDLIACYGFF